MMDSAAGVSSAVPVPCAARAARIAGSNLTGGKIMHKKIVAVSAAAVGVGLAACSSSSGPATGTVSLNGVTDNVTNATSNAAVLPLHLTGVITDRGTVTLAQGTRTTLKLSGGDVTVDHTNRRASPVVSDSACSVSQDASGTYKIVSGTGRYKGASGSGTYTEAFAASLKKNGKCDLAILSGSDGSPASAKLVFRATGTWTVPNSGG
jgi:hypothetical protein